MGKGEGVRMRMSDENAKKNPQCLVNTRGYHTGMSTGCYGYRYGSFYPSSTPTCNVGLVGVEGFAYGFIVFIGSI